MDNYENAMFKLIRTIVVDAPFVSYDRTDAIKKSTFLSFTYGQDAS